MKNLSVARVVAVVAGVGLVVLAGCSTKEVDHGEQEVGYTYVDSPAQTGPTDGALAVGTRVVARGLYSQWLGEDEVHHRGYMHHGASRGGGPAEVDDISSGDPETLEVGELEDAEHFEMIAHEPSWGTEIEMTVQHIGTDDEVRTAEVESVDVEPLCDSGVYLTEEPARFDYGMYDEGGDLLTGAGYYPLEVDPAEGGELDTGHGRLNRVEVEAGTEPGGVELIPEVDGEALDFELVDPQAVDDAVWTDNDETSVAVGSTISATSIEIMADERPVCGPLSGVLEVTHQTPEICGVEIREYGNDHGIDIQGLEAGDCEVRFEIAGAEIDETIEVDVEQSGPPTGG